MARHIGQHVETGAHLVVHFMLIPEQTTNALVTETARVPEPLRGALLRALGEAQGPEDLAQALSRRIYGDTNKPLFQVLHETGHLKAVPVDKIVMTPDGNHRIPLRAVLESIGRLPTDPGNSADMSGQNQSTFNPHRYNAVANETENTLRQAQNLLVEAEILESDVRAKRAQAYSLAPSLNPALQQPTPSAPVEPTTDTDSTSDGESA